MNVRRFLFGIHFLKSIILTSANTADCSRLTPSSPVFLQTDRQRQEKIKEEGRREELELEASHLFHTSAIKVKEATKLG